MSVLAETVYAHDRLTPNTRFNETQCKNQYTKTTLKWRSGSNRFRTGLRAQWSCVDLSVSRGSRSSIVESRRNLLRYH